MKSTFLRRSTFLLMILLSITLSDCSIKETLPVLATTPVTNITSTTASAGGKIISDGGSTITACGICWSTNINPRITDTKSNFDHAVNQFESDLYNLSPSTTYHVRAYATNSVGAAYGNDMTFAAVYTIGENVNGGLVFYIDGTGIHGLVCAPSDQSTGAPWSCAGPVIGANGTAVGTGSQNTIDIVNACSTSLGIAARICSDLDLNSYTDWYLPSKDELYLMYTNL